MVKERDEQGVTEETKHGTTDDSLDEAKAPEKCDKTLVRRTRGRKSVKPSTNAARERSRVQNLKQAFLELQKALPNVPSGTKLSKLDILLLATNYISHLMSKLSNGHLKEHLSRLKDTGTLHPIKKWPMRSRLYVSDPMWLYRSGRQSITLSQNVESSSSSSPTASCEEGSPVLETVDLPSPSDSSEEDRDNLSPQYRPSCREEEGYQYHRVPQSCLAYSYSRPSSSYTTVYDESRFQTSSCVYDKVMPNLNFNNH